MSKKMIALTLVILMVAALATGCGGSASPGSEQKAPAPQKFINIATGSTAGTYYPLGGALADIWNKNIAGANSTVQSTGSSIANINLLKDGKVEVIFVQNDVSYYAFNGTELFKDNPYKELRGMATLYPETVQIIALANKNINSIADLKGKRVGVGSIGSVVEANARQILATAGIDFKDIKPHYLSFAEASNNMKDNNIDAAFVTAGIPTAAVQDIATQHKVTVLPIDDSIADPLIKQYPFYTKTTIPANTYNGQDKEIKTVSVRSMLAVSTKLDDQSVYELTKTMFENRSRIEAAHAIGKMIKAETALDGMPITVHPGAQKYYDEVLKK